jgi:hypothetical protein
MSKLQIIPAQKLTLEVDNMRIKPFPESSVLDAEHTLTYKIYFDCPQNITQKDSSAIYWYNHPQNCIRIARSSENGHASSQKLYGLSTSWTLGSESPIYTGMPLKHFSDSRSTTAIITSSLVGVHIVRWQPAFISVIHFTLHFSRRRW